MGGRGPLAKSDDRRARRNKPTQPHTVLEFVPAEQPPLPENFPWPARTREWWATWGECPQAALFSETDWEFLLDTALLHAQTWASAEAAVRGLGKMDTSLLPELRLRVAKLAATMEDRVRLRIMFAMADERDAARDGSEPAASSE
jgi:hypothetical protein